jgi:hypothetical protein
MTDSTKTIAASEVLFSKIVTTYTRWMSRKTGNLDLQRSDAMTDVARDLGVFFSLVIKAGALASSLGTLSLRCGDLQPLEIRRTAFFRVRWKSKVSSAHQQGRQCE